MANEVKLDVVSMKVFGITSRRYRQLAKDEKVPEVKGGKIDFVLACKNLIDYYRKLAEGGGSLTLTDQRAELTRLKVEEKSIEVEQLKGNLISRDAISRLLVERIHIIKADMGVLERRLTKCVKCSEIVKKFHRHMMNTYSKKAGFLK